MPTVSAFGAVRAFFSRVFGREDPSTLQRWPSMAAIAGVVVTAERALELATVWACMDIVSKSLSSCTWNVYEPVPGTKRRTLLDQDMRAWLLNTRPNPEMTGIGFREALFLQALASGNSYAEIVTDAAGRVAELWPLDGARVRPNRSEDGSLVYDYSQPSGETVRLPQSRVFHLRGPGLNGLMGENIVARAARSLAVAAAQERFSADFFGRGAQLAGVLEIPTKVGAPQHELLRKEWAETHSGGGKNAFKPLILEGGMQFKPVSIEPGKASLVDDKKFSVEEICRWFGVPPHKVQHLEHATFSNIEHSSIEFVRDSLRPWERRICQEADAKLFSQTRGPWRYTEIDLSPLTRGDAQSRAQAQASWRQNGIMTANEIRAQEGLDDVGDAGDVLLVQQNMTRLDTLGAAPASQPQPGAVPVEPALAVHRQAAVSALKGARNRFLRRLENRAASVASKPDAGRRMDEFRADQVAVVFDELLDFAPHFRAVAGRELTLADAQLLMSVEPEQLLLTGS